MRKTLFITSFALLFLGCSSGVKTQKTVQDTEDKKQFDTYAHTITQEKLKTHLFVIASDEMQGRDTGSEGQKKAGRYLIEQYQKMGISFPPTADGFYQPIPSKAMKTAWSPTLPDSENIWAFIEGGEKKDEVLILSAHYDHIGMRNGEIFNGADDNASGTAALLEIAQAFITAKNAGHTPMRSILFLHVTAEEYGLHGSRYYTDHPIFSISNTVANINIDMIGRRGFGKEDNDNYVYVIGSDRLSTDLHTLSEEANTYIGLELDYTYNDLNDPNRFYYRSDHYNFAKKGIPAIFYFDGVHQDYHKTTDTPDKIDFPLFTKRTKLAFATAWKLATAENRPVVDKEGK
jgi:hypothetical protein